MPIRVRILLLLLTLMVGSNLRTGWAANNEPIHVLPDPALTTFRTYGMDYWKQELPDFLAKYLPLPNGRVVSGGVHPASGSCTSAAFSLEGLTSSSNRITANGAGGAVTVNYGAANIGGDCVAGHSDVCWVVGSGSDAATLPGTNFQRSGTSNIYVDCNSTSQPVTPTDSTLLMKVTINSGAITAVEDLGHPLAPGTGWVESHAVGVRTDNSKAPIAWFTNTFAVPITSDTINGTWHTINVKDLGIPVDAQAVFLAGILIITHGTNVQTCNLTVALRAKGDTLDPGNYIFQTVEAAIGGGQRSTASSWVPVRNGQFELQWDRDVAGIGLEYPSNCSYAINLSAQAYTRYAPVDSVGTIISEPTPNPDSVYVASYATGGDGTSVTPWTGWDTALLWNLGDKSFYFQPGHYKTITPILVTASRTRIRGAGKGLAILHYEPTATQTNGAFTFSNGVAQNVQSSLESLSIRTIDATYLKIGVRVNDVGQFLLRDVAIGTDGGWTGAISKALEVNGAQQSTFTGLELHGDLPIHLRDNANSTTDLDTTVFRDIVAVGTLATGLYSGNRLPIVAMDTGLNVSNVSFEGVQAWQRNAYGVLWQDTTTSVTGSNLVLSNIAWTGSTYASGYLLYLEHNTGLRNLHVHNVAGGTSTAGIRLRKGRQVLLEQVYYTGSGLALDLDATDYPVTLLDFYKGTGTLSVGALVQAYDTGNSDSTHITTRLYDTASVTSTIPTLATTAFTVQRATTSGTTLTGSNIAISAGWGTTASVSGVGGVDARGSLTVTSAGTGQAASPTITVTFADGAWAATPACNAFRLGGDQLSLIPAQTSGSTTQAVFTFPGTPVAAQMFSIGFRCSR